MHFYIRPWDFHWSRQEGKRGEEHFHRQGRQRNELLLSVLWKVKEGETKEVIS